MTTDTALTTPSLLRRLAAMVYDSLLLIAVTMLYGFVVVAINLAIQGAPAEGQRLHWGYGAPLVFAGWLGVMLGFFCYFWQRAGQTLGMKTWRLQIRSVQGGLPNLKQCLLRCLCAPLSLLCLGAGYWWMYGDAEQQTLHDRLSGTRTYLLAKETKTEK